MDAKRRAASWFGSRSFKPYPPDQMHDEAERPDDRILKAFHEL